MSKDTRFLFLFVAGFAGFIIWLALHGTSQGKTDSMPRISTAGNCDQIDDPRFIRAVISTEEDERGSYTIGDENLADKAYGCLQVRQPCMDDVNRFAGTHYRAEDCLGNDRLSIWVFKVYLGHYATRARLGRNPTHEDMIRIWKGGPTGWKKASTAKYARKLREAMDRLG